jgi:hypothetical protein
MKSIDTTIRRRELLGATAFFAPAIFLTGCSEKAAGIRLEQAGLIGSLRKVNGPATIDGAAWYEAADINDGIEHRFSAGALTQAKYITTDMLLGGNHMFAFLLTLQEGEEGPKFSFRWAGLNQCSFRVRLPIGLLDMNQFFLEREGGFLKPWIFGDRVDLDKVDRALLTVYRKSPRPARWCMTDLLLTKEEPGRITDPVLPNGPLLDDMGQSTIHDWPAKSTSVEEVTARIRGQFENVANQKRPDTVSRWGGWKSKRFTQGTGFFATHRDGNRWWLVDPDGYAFWSAGVDDVRVDTATRYDSLETALTWLPEQEEQYQEIFGSPFYSGRPGKYINYLAANMIRVFGADGWREKWAEIALAELRRLRFNTVGNWSEWNFAKKAGFPYVRPMRFQPKRVKLIYRDFPDVFDPAFARDAADYASALQETADDPAFLGYFLMNEPTWGFSGELPPAGMLFVTPECHTRRELAAFLRTKHADDAALSAAWKIETTFDKVAGGAWSTRLTDGANKDLQEFSILMADLYFKTISAACKEVDPNHLNLGMRWAGVPPMWAVEGMKSFDVFSMNCYEGRVPRDVTDKIHELIKRPVIIGEGHFGALDVGLPASGLGHLHNQTDRGKAYRVYLEDAAANPNCVGAHWFTLYDESALGRGDGENYNIGFLDVCNRPYQELGEAGIASHERIYDVAAGKVKPYNDVPEYLPKLY